MLELPSPKHLQSCLPTDMDRHLLRGACESPGFWISHLESKFASKEVIVAIGSTPHPLPCLLFGNQKVWLQAPAVKHILPHPHAPPKKSCEKRLYSCHMGSVHTLNPLLSPQHIIFLWCWGLNSPQSPCHAVFCQSVYSVGNSFHKFLTPNYLSRCPSWTST